MHDHEKDDVNINLTRQKESNKLELKALDYLCENVCKFYIENYMKAI